MWVSTFPLSVCGSCGAIAHAQLSLQLLDLRRRRRPAADDLVCRDKKTSTPRDLRRRAVLNWVSNCNDFVDAEAATAKATNNLERTFADCYVTYQERLRQANASTTSSMR